MPEEPFERDMATELVLYSLDTAQELRERLVECRDWMERAADCLEARNFGQAQWMAGHLRKQANYNRSILEETKAWQRATEGPKLPQPGEEPF